MVSAFINNNYNCAFICSFMQLMLNPQTHQLHPIFPPTKPQNPNFFVTFLTKYRRELTDIIINSQIPNKSQQ